MPPARLLTRSPPRRILALRYNALYVTVQGWLPSLTCEGEPLIQVGPLLPQTCTELTDATTAALVCGLGSKCYAFIDRVTYGGGTTSCRGMRDEETPAAEAREAAREVSLFYFLFTRYMLVPGVQPYPLVHFNIILRILFVLTII